MNWITIIKQLMLNLNFEVVTYTYHLLSGHWPDFKTIYSTYHRLTNGLPTWVEQSKDIHGQRLFQLSFIQALK